MNGDIFGELESEKIVKEKQICRQIVQEINNFGTNERQRLFIIYLLGLELENSEAKYDLSTIAKEHCSKLGMILSENS